LPHPSSPSKPLPWYAQWWVPAVLVGACATYLLVLAGGYVTASAEPTLPIPRAERASVATAPAPVPEPARLVAAPAPVEKKPKPRPKPKPVRVVPAPASVAVTLVQSRALSRALARSASTLSRVSEAISWTPFGRSSAAAPSSVSSVWTVPVAQYRLTARFGDHGRHWARTHTGLDFAAPVGTPVVAVDAGVVVSTGWNGSYGQQVAVRHADGTVTSYAHLSSIGVARGAAVARGQLVGRVGATGNVTGPHLHLEVRPGGGDPVDPTAALREHGIPIS
jgi:murein DD-endopeptidase MepM/ murein hydrolase activator NlpD